MVEEMREEAQQHISTRSTQHAEMVAAAQRTHKQQQAPGGCQSILLEGRGDGGVARWLSSATTRPPLPYTTVDWQGDVRWTTKGRLFFFTLACIMHAFIFWFCFVVCNNSCLACVCVRARVQCSLRVSGVARRACAHTAACGGANAFVGEAMNTPWCDVNVRTAGACGVRP